jgi:predicted transcriptional regulator
VAMIGEFFDHNKIVIVVGEDDEPKGIVTKIDFIDYVSDRM